jgi:phosphate transport system protein
VTVVASIHTDRAFEEELRSLRERLLAMAGQVEQLIERSVRAFVKKDVALADETIGLDRIVNEAEIAIDQSCLQIIAKRQPMGSDLRFVTHAFKMVTDLERIGDLAVNICERAKQLGELPLPDEPLRAGVPAMAKRAQAMVHDALDAFIEQDAARARQVIVDDDEVDRLYAEVFHAALKRMLDDGTELERGIHVQSVAKYLERIGDHATNLAEHVVFMVEGMDIRYEGAPDVPDDAEG